MAEKVGIKETMEVLNAIDKILIIVPKILSDGKITFSDIWPVMDLMKPINRAIQDINMAVVELSDIDDEERKILVDKMSNLINNLILAVGPKK